MPTLSLSERFAGLTKRALSEATLVEARQQVDTAPTDAQKESGNYAKGHVTWAGLGITIENPKGSTRSGTDRNGKTWSITMKHDYGYFKGSEGRDGDHVDVFLGPELESELIFIVNQVRPDSGRFDEHKVILGTINEAMARRVYLNNYEDGWQGLGSIVPMTLGTFKNWILDAELTSKRASDALPPTLAVDLDGTLAGMYDKFDPDRIELPRPGAKKWLDKFHDAGVRIIIHTVRQDNQVLRDWLAEHEIPFDHINTNPDQPDNSSDKLYADVYWDDRAVSARGQLAATVDEVAKRLNVKLAGDVVMFADPMDVWHFFQLIL